MQKGSSSSKKAIAPALTNLQEHYRSQSSKASTTKAKQPYAFQNMKEFKCEIDHEIAKCLDTLDRQGLKFLKETLRASKIFGLNTQELGLTQPVQENIQAEDSPPKQKEVPKKIEPLKPTVQIKKIKPQVVKKVQPANKTGKHSQSNLTEKINKKLESLNIKTGKKLDVKPAAKRVEAEIQKPQANQAEIAQQIQVEQVEEKFETLPQEQAKNIETFNIPYEKNSNGNPIFYESSKQWVKNHSKEINVSPIAEQGSLLKPFCKKQFKKHHEEAKHKDHKDYGIQISKEEDFRKAINDAPAKKEEEVKKPVEDEVVFENLSIKEKVHEQVHEKVETKEANVGNETVMTESTDPNIQNLISAIGRLSPGKRSKLQRIIEKLESADNYDSMSSFVSGVTNKDNEVSYHKPYIAQRSFAKNSEVKDNHSKSRTKMQKVEKATSLKSSLIKKINHSLTPQNHGNLTPGIKKKQEGTPINTEKASQGNVLSMYDDAKSQMISVQARGEKKVNNLLQEVKEKKEEPSNGLTQSNVFSNPSETGQKLIKIGKKKLQVTSITFKIISNGGHNSLVGLTSIYLYNCAGDIITVDETNLKSSNTKLLKLFDATKTEGWLTSLSNATISLDNISQPIGGIRIVNWNKSQLEVDRQADLMQIWINDQLHWRGQVRGGSYKEDEVYATNIKVTEKHFEFPAYRMEEILPIEERSPKKLNSLQRSVKITFDEPEKDRPESCWLEKQSFQLKLREIQEQEKREEKVKKIGSIRNTTVIGSSLNIDKIMPTEPVLDARPFDFGPNWRRQQKRQEMRYETESKSALRSQINDDILLELSKGVDARRKKQEQSSNKKKEELCIKPKEQSLSKKQQQDYLVQKEKEQDEEFEKILQSMEQRSKPKECIKVSTPKRVEQQKPVQNKGKLIAEKNFEDFMKDSLFDDKPIQRRFQNKPIRQEKLAEQPRREINPKTPKGSTTKQLDNLIDELNGIVGEAGDETGEEFCIPELPRGKEISLVLLSNWGHQSFIGLNGIELFDSDGQLVKPVGVACSLVSSKQLYEKLFKAQLLTSDQKAQLKFQKGKRVAISLILAERTELAAIRVWNYNGHRVHSNIGVRKLHIKFDVSFIFSGEIQQSSGTSEDAYKFCEYILFTENNNILTKIAQGDWLNRINRREEEERALFKTTLENFHRPLTRNDEESVKRQPQEIPIQKQPVRLPKRICFEYDPPQLPEGFVIRLAIHSSWGDRFFIGLNFLEVFNDKGQNITTKNLVQVRADPSSVAKLPGYEGDRRVPANLTKGRSTSAQSTWLAPLLSDVERIEKGRPNIVLLQYSKPSKISAINFYNYTKTPARGAREVQVFLDDSLLYRGYLRKADSQSGALHTTISFTRDPSLLEAVNYSGYNEDHLEQEVALVNQERIIKAGSVFDANLIRPMTGKLLA